MYKVQLRGNIDSALEESRMRRGKVLDQNINPWKFEAEELLDKCDFLNIVLDPEL